MVSGWRTERITFEDVERELQRQVSGLYGADPATIRIASDRLRRMAERVEDELWRKRAIQRAEQLPSLVAGPRGGSSPQYQEAERLLGLAISTTGTSLAELDAIAERIAQLSEQAPDTEAMAILRMNSTLARLPSGGRG